jgi:hypothetical protein
MTGAHPTFIAGRGTRKGLSPRDKHHLQEFELRPWQFLPLRKVFASATPAGRVGASPFGEQ